MTTALLPAIACGTWQVDPVHSSVEFMVMEAHAHFTLVAGRFTHFEGTLTTGVTAGDWRAQGVIRAASVTTAHEQRDAHLRAADFLNVAAFPDILFASERIEPAGDDTLRVVGHVVLQGQDRPLTMRVTIHGHGKTADGVERLVLSGTGDLSFGPMAVQLTAHLSAGKSA